MPGIVLSCMDFKNKMWDLLISSSQHGNEKSNVSQQRETLTLLFGLHQTLLTLNAC